MAATWVATAWTRWRQRRQPAQPLKVAVNATVACSLEILSALPTKSTLCHLAPAEAGEAVAEAEWAIPTPECDADHLAIVASAAVMAAAMPPLQYPPAADPR